MPRYLFNAHTGLCHAQDFEVLDLPNLAAACAEARKVARHFWAYLPSHLRQEALTIEIMEETGQEFSVLRFDTVDALAQRLRGHGLDEASIATMPGWERGIVHTVVARRSQ